MMSKYYQLAVSGTEADLDIYGDITSWPWAESDVSSYGLSQELAKLDPSIEVINVNINSCGGDVAEGLAIHNMLVRHPAKVRTRVDGFACSIASVIFMAGDVRSMSRSSLLMVHNAWTYASGDAAKLRKAAEDIDIINSASKAAYLDKASISEDELTSLMDSETWIVPDDALAWGFATEVESDGGSSRPSQSAREAVYRALLQGIRADAGDGGRGPFARTVEEDVPDEDETDDEDETGSPGDQDPDEAGSDGEDEEADDDSDVDQEDDQEDDETAPKEMQEAAFAAFMRKVSL